MNNNRIIAIGAALGLAIGGGIAVASALSGPSSTRTDDNHTQIVAATTLPSETPTATVTPTPTPLATIGSVKGADDADDDSVAASTADDQESADANDDAQGDEGDATFQVVPQSSAQAQLQVGNADQGDGEHGQGGGSDD